jgi:DUF1009 family protein
VGLALIAGRGALPVAVAQAAQPRPYILAMQQSPPEALDPDHIFRIEQLGGVLRDLRRKGISQICMCGGQDRPRFEVRHLDWRTALLVPKILKVLKGGEDSALRLVIHLFESHGISVVGAHEIAPRLLPPSGVLTNADLPEGVVEEAALGDRVSALQGQEDLGQSCLLRGDQILIREGTAGTDAMLSALAPSDAQSAILYKAPKPGQDLRVDMPVIGVKTVEQAAQLGLKGIVIEHGGVMVLDLPHVLRRLNAEGMFLWVRERKD